MDIQAIYGDDPHTTVSYQNTLSVDNPRDFDLSSTLQFVAEGRAVLFDFSAYVLVDPSGDLLEEERKRVTEEISAFNALRDTVDRAHDEFLTNASKALDLLASLQPS